MHSWWDTDSISTTNIATCLTSPFSRQQSDRNFKDERLVHKVILVISDLNYSGPARLLTSLATGLPPEHVRVCVLGEETAWCAEIRAAGVGVECLGWRRLLDVRPLVSLRRLIVRERPEIVHAWGLPAAWSLVLSGTCRPGSLFLSAALPPRRLSLAERWLLRRCGMVIAIGQAEAHTYRRLGVADSRLLIVPPGVGVTEGTPPATPKELPPGARAILAVGPITMHAGHREAVWALNVMRCLYDDVHLVVVGTGPDEERVRHFADLIQMTEWVHFTGEVLDVRPWLARADVVWVPSLREAGRQAALEAMAAGRAVVASRLPGLAEVIDDGRTGFLVEPGDKAELCRQTRMLFENANLRRQVGEAGRQHVIERFGQERMVEAYKVAYGDEGHTRKASGAA
jgi:glycosyltransferase involved in cell wall biosynthesis